MPREPRQERRPMARVTRVALFTRQVSEHLGPAALDLLLASASRLSEGQVAPDGRYYGTTMLTIDLSQVAGRVTERCDVATATRLARELAEEPSVVARVRALAADDARARAGGDVGELALDLRVRAEGAWIFLDADVEAQAASLAAAE